MKCLFNMVVLEEDNKLNFTKLIKTIYINRNQDKIDNMKIDLFYIKGVKHLRTSL